MEAREDVEIELQQVMGLNADLLTSKGLVPKFKFNGEDPGAFERDFKVVAAAYGVTAVYEWPKEKDMTVEEGRKNTIAMLVLRNYLTEKVLKILLVGQPVLASTVYNTLKTIFLTNDARTKVHVNRDLHSCEMALGESMTDFVARVNNLMEESERLGEVYSPQARMIMVATRLREPWRTLANDKLDREDDCTYEALIQFLVLRERDTKDTRRDEAYLAGHSTNGVGRQQQEERGGQQNRGGGRGGGRGGRGRGGRGRGEEGRTPANVCHNCGQTGHWRRFCPNNQCFRCGGRGHLSYDCTNHNMGQNVARMTVAETVEDNDGGMEFQNFAYMANELIHTLGQSAFVLDGAATTHVVDKWVKLDNERPVNVLVKGIGNIKATSKGTLYIQGIMMGTALRVPGLGANLISEGVLQTNGCEITSKAGWRKVLYNGRTIISASLENGLFVWRPEDRTVWKQFKSYSQLENSQSKIIMAKQQCFVAGSRPQSNLVLWHLRMGHLNVADLHILKTRSTGIKNLSGSNLQMCISCCRAKCSQRSFSGQGEKAIKPMQTVYVDLWGQ